MKKTLMLIACLSLLIGLVYANDVKQAVMKRTIDQPQTSMQMEKTRNAPDYIFTKTPTSLLTSFNDYMIGSYNGLPLRVIPESAGGGYFMTYHGQTAPTGLRRVYYAYLSPAGEVINNTEITSLPVPVKEGFPTLAVDPVSGKPMYAWHTNSDTDVSNEVRFISDAFFEGSDGLWNDLEVIIDNPVTIGATTDNEFIWPTAQIGPSPVAGKRRVYVSARNVTNRLADDLPSENAFIRFADFSGDDLENAVAMNWQTTTIPVLDAWHTDPDHFRRPNNTLVCDNSGSVYYIGYHDMDSTLTAIVEDDLDVFKNTNYGVGEWTRVTSSSNIPTWNPPESENGPGYFMDTDLNIPWTDDQLYWSLINSNHLNATIDDVGKIHFPGSWGYLNVKNTYYPALQYVKELVFDTVNNSFNIKDIYPQQNPLDTFNETFTPWDMEAPFGVVDSFFVDSTGTPSPGIVTDWNFPYWNEDSHDNAMFFHCNSMKVTEKNGHGMLAVVWQNSLRARFYNKFADTDYAAYANTPEIYIAVSDDNGDHWSEPIVINNQETLQFAGLKPMWVYPADKIKYVGMQGENKIGKLGLMFYDDNTWGSNTHSPGEFPNDGGRVMFTEIQVVFPHPVANSDETITPVTKMLNQNYPNPFNPETAISFDMPKTANANLSVYNVKGQLVKTLLNGKADFGRNSLVWNGTDNSGANVSSGLYFYRLSTDGKTETRKMMLMK